MLYIQHLKAIIVVKNNNQGTLQPEKEEERGGIMISPVRAESSWNIVLLWKLFFWVVVLIEFQFDDVHEFGIKSNQK